MALEQEAAPPVIPPEEEEAALSASRRISSAHLDRYQLDGQVVLRHLVPLAMQSSCRRVVAAALAAKLLGVPACRSISCAPVSPDAVAILLVLEPQTLENVQLEPGDVLAVQSDRVGQHSAVEVLVFAPCAPEEPDAVWHDRFHGARGTAPTSVLQWSKGSIY